MKRLEETENFLNQLVNDDVCPGFNYGVVSEKDYCGSVGYKSLFPNRELNSIDTMYDLASLTKVVSTVMMICRLKEMGKLDYTDKVSKYLSRFKHTDLTIYDLLTHTSGLPADVNSKEIVSKEELVNQIYDLDLQYKTGSRVVYSDIGFILLGFIIEKVYGKRLDECAKELVFEPLDMKNTCFNPTNKEICAPTEISDTRNVIKGIVHDEKTCSLNGMGGSAGVFSNVEDMMNYCKMLLNDGMFNNKRFLSKETIDLLFSEMILEADANRTRSFCFITGNNNFVIKDRDNVISFHGFTGPSVSIDKNNHTAIVLLTNRVHPTRKNILINKQRKFIADKIYDELDKIERKEEDQMRLF